MFEPRYGPLVVELPSWQRGEATLLAPLSPPIRAREPRSESRSIPPAAEPTRPSSLAAVDHVKNDPVLAKPDRVARSPRPPLPRRRRPSGLCASSRARAAANPARALGRAAVDFFLT